MSDILANELNELMGINRNAPIDSRLRQEHFTDSDACKYFLVSACPNDLFPKTKWDLGPCHKRHAELFKNQHLVATDPEKIKSQNK